MIISRRQLSALVPALAAAQTKVRQVLPSKTYRFEDLTTKTNGENRSWDIFDGKNHSGIQVDIHITSLGPGLMPHAPHHHVHEEMVMLQTGVLDVTIEG